MHKTILKRQYENFVSSRSKGQDKTYDKFQKLISQLVHNDEVISQEDANIKLLRSLPPAWNNISLIMRNKPDIDTLSMDDLYNNLKVYDAEIKGQSSSGSNSHNVAFVSYENTNSINETVNAAHDIPAAGLKEQPFASIYADDIDTDDLEEMDLKWQVAMITMRVKKFIKRVVRNLNFNGKEPVGFDKTKFKCYNCHKRGHFARECRTPRNQGNKSVNNERRVITVETPASALVVQDGLGGYDWSYQAKERPTDFALMVHSSDSANSSNSEDECEDTAKGKNVTTTGPKAVVNDTEGKKENVVKSSACYIWRPKGKLVDHTSKDSGSYTLKRFNYVDPNGRLKSAMAWVPKKINSLNSWLQQQKDQVVNLDSYSPKPLQCRKIPICYDDDDDEESFIPLRDIIISELPSCIAITPILSTKETKESLIMRDEHLDTIPEKELDKFIKSSVENLVLNPNPHHFSAESDLIESLLNQDSSITSSSKIDSILDEFVDEFILLKSIPPGIDEANCDSEEEIRLIKKLLYDNSSPRPPEEINSKNSNAVIKSLSPSPIPVEDIDSLTEEIDLSLTPIKNDDYESEGDILILKELLSNDSLSLPENESFHFDIPSSRCPPAKPPNDDEIKPIREF
nr:hypothetical protein [Tanacetum cinerariifolium]